MIEIIPVCLLLYLNKILGSQEVQLLCFAVNISRFQMIAT